MSDDCRCGSGSGIANRDIRVGLYSDDGVEAMCRLSPDGCSRVWAKAATDVVAGPTTHWEVTVGTRAVAVYRVTDDAVVLYSGDEVAAVCWRGRFGRWRVRSRWGSWSGRDAVLKACRMVVWDATEEES